MHPDLANLEQFYIRTRADVTAGMLHGQEGIARVQANTITDATGRTWAVDPMSPDPNRAMFKAAVPGQAPVSVDPSSYQPIGSMPHAGSSAFPETGFEAGFPSATFPVEAEEKKSRFKRDKSKSAVKTGSPLDKLKDLPRFVWLAGALFIVLMLVALQLLGGSTSAPTATSSPATVSPGATVPGTPTTAPATTVPAVAPGELSAARMSEMVSALESLDVARAQTVILAPIDSVAYATFIAKHQAGERLLVNGAPTEIAGAPAATVVIRRVDSAGVEIGSATLMLAKNTTTGEWLLRDLPVL